MTNAEYHSHPAVSKSDLDLINRSPMYYKYIKSNPKVQTEAMLLGSVLHKLILEADIFSSEYAIAPVCDRRTKAGKEEYSAFIEEAQGKAVITAEMFETASGIAKDVRNNSVVTKLLCGGKAEQSYFWEEKGVACKCRPEAFVRTAYNYRYHVQAWWYLHGLNMCGINAQEFIFVAFEKEPPYGVCVYAADDLMLELGETEAMKNLETYRECTETGNWYGYEKTPEIHSLSLPEWVIRKYF